MNSPTTDKLGVGWMVLSCGEESELSKKDIEAIYPLSPTQQGMLVHSLDDPSLGKYIQQMVCSFREDLDLTVFVNASRQDLLMKGLMNLPRLREE
jgi:hypothetical protein